MPSIQVTGIMKDPITGVESDGELRIISTINYGQTAKNANALVVLSSAGEYDFQLVHGKHLFAVKSKGAQAFTNIGTVVVGEGSPSPIDIITLIATSNEEPDPILITQLQLIAAEAAASAAEAAQSELNAANSANAAAQSEANAAQSELNAANSASASALSETNAANSASSAQASATNAAQSETNAANSATAAAQSETNAANSALSANDSAAAAQTSANNAAQSELNASNSATAAALSETNAAQSAASASDDADRAEAAALTASSGVIDRGSWDASAGNFPTPTLTPEERTDWYRISVAGLMSDGVQPDVEVKVSDNLYWDKQNDLWYKIDNTDKVNSVNGKEGDVVLVADDIDDVYSKTEVLQITDPLGTRVTDLENTVDSHDLSLDNHETRITDVETLASNNQTALGTKADADKVIAKSHGTGGGVDVPRWTDDASRPDMTGVDKAVFGFNNGAQESELWNPETQEWGAVGGGGIPPIKEYKTASFIAANKSMYGMKLASLTQAVMTISDSLPVNAWTGIRDVDSTFETDVTGVLITLTGTHTFTQLDEDGNETQEFFFDAKNGTCILTQVEAGKWYAEVLTGSDAEYLQRQLDIGKQRLVVGHTVAAGVAGGSSVSGNQVRKLNTIEENTITGASHNTSTYVSTLPAGEYLVTAHGAAYSAFRHRIRLENSDTNELIVLGTMEYVHTTNPSQSESLILRRKVVLESTTNIHLIHYISEARTTNGLGVDSPDGFPSTFASVVYERVK